MRIRLRREIASVSAKFVEFEFFVRFLLRNFPVFCAVFSGALPRQPGDWCVAWRIDCAAARFEFRNRQDSAVGQRQQVPIACGDNLRAVGRRCACHVCCHRLRKRPRPVPDTEAKHSFKKQKQNTSLKHNFTTNLFFCVFVLLFEVFLFLFDLDLEKESEKRKEKRFFFFFFFLFFVCFSFVSKLASFSLFVSQSKFGEKRFLTEENKKQIFE